MIQTGFTRRLLGFATAVVLIGSHPVFAQSEVPEPPLAVSGLLVANVQTPPTPASSGRWIGRHPVLAGTLIGGSGAMVWQAATCHRWPCNAGIAGLVGAGAGAYTGLIISAVHKAHRKEPVSRKMKIGIAAGAIGGAFTAFLACYGAGGCGGTS